LLFLYFNFFLHFFLYLFAFIYIHVFNFVILTFRNHRGVSTGNRFVGSSYLWREILFLQIEDIARKDSLVFCQVCFVSSYLLFFCFFLFFCLVLFVCFLFVWYDSVVSLV
jgi:hypothetical protein